MGDTSAADSARRTRLAASELSVRASSPGPCRIEVGDEQSVGALPTTVHEFAPANQYAAAGRALLAPRARRNRSRVADRRRARSRCGRSRRCSPRPATAPGKPSPTDTARTSHEDPHAARHQSRHVRQARAQRSTARSRWPRSTRKLLALARELRVGVESFQTNDEGAMCERIHRAFVERGRRRDHQRRRVDALQLRTARRARDPDGAYRRDAHVEQRGPRASSGSTPSSPRSARATSAASASTATCWRCARRCRPCGQATEPEPSPPDRCNMYCLVH